MALPSDLIDLLAEFDADQVEYLLVGGQALAVHGVPRFTPESEVWVRDERQNLVDVETLVGEREAWRSRPSASARNGRVLTPERAMLTERCAATGSSPSCVPADD